MLQQRMIGKDLSRNRFSIQLFQKQLTSPKVKSKPERNYGSPVFYAAYRRPLTCRQTSEPTKVWN